MVHIKRKVDPREEGKCPVNKFDDISRLLDFCPDCKYANLEASWANLSEICRYEPKRDN